MNDNDSVPRQEQNYPEISNSATAREALVDLLAKLFSEDELLIWIELGFEHKISAQIARAGSRIGTAFCAVAVFTRRGRIDDLFWSKLEEARPARKREITTIQEKWNAETPRARDALCTARSHRKRLATVAAIAALSIALIVAAAVWPRKECGLIKVIDKNAGMGSIENARIRTRLANGDWVEVGTENGFLRLACDDRHPGQLLTIEIHDERGEAHNMYIHLPRNIAEHKVFELGEFAKGAPQLEPTIRRSTSAPTQNLQYFVKPKRHSMIR